MAAEEQLRLKEERLREILEHSTNVFYSQAPDGTLTYVSPQSRRLLGIDPAQVQRHRSMLVTENPENETARRATDRAFATGQKQPSYEAELWGADGERIWVEVNE
ncbi:MAG: PAS domain S-box protein, partial [Gemmatimonadales bacterium]